MGLRIRGETGVGLAHGLMRATVAEGEWAEASGAEGETVIGSEPIVSAVLVSGLSGFPFITSSTSDALRTSSPHLTPAP